MDKIFFLAFTIIVLVPKPVYLEKADWIIDKPVKLVSQNIAVNTNIKVVKGGELILVNSTLYFNNERKEGYVLEVFPGGKLTIISSTITGPKDRYYSIFVHYNASLTIVNSTIRNAGWKDQAETSEYKYIGPAYTRDYSIGGHGLEINTTVKEFKGNLFENIASIRFYSSNNVVENNTVTGIRHEGLAFMRSSNNNIVRNNIIVNASTMKRETYAIRFYPGTRNQQVYNNTIKRVEAGIMVSLIPPWSPGTNFTIHDNEMRDVTFGFTGKLKDSRVTTRGTSIRSPQSTLRRPATLSSRIQRYRM